MFKSKEGVTYEFYHLGIPTQESKEGEFYSEKFDMHTTEIPGSRIHAQWHRFGESCPLHPLIQTIPHVAFKVNDIEKACERRGCDYASSRAHSRLSLCYD